MKNIIDKLHSLSKDNKLHHGLLFTGAHRDEAKYLTFEFAKKELNQHYNDESSKQNYNATEDSNKKLNSLKFDDLFLAGTHPDFLFIDIEPNSNFIKIEQIRVLNDFVQTKPQMSNIKIALINYVDKLSTQAANALLKTLEEPVSQTLIMMLSDSKHSLPETISSRCMEINLDIINNLNCRTHNFNANVKSTKEMKNNTIEILNDLHNLLISKSLRVTTLAENWQKIYKSDVLIDTLYKVISNIILNSFNSNTFQNLPEKQLLSLVALHRNISTLNLFKILDNIVKFKKYTKSGYNLNTLLFIEQQLELICKISS